MKECVKLVKDQYNNQKEELIFLKDTINEKYECPQDEELAKVLNIASNNNILIYTVQVEKFPYTRENKNYLNRYSKQYRNSRYEQNTKFKNNTNAKKQR